MTGKDNGCMKSRIRRKAVAEEKGVEVGKFGVWR